MTIQDMNLYRLIGQVRHVGQEENLWSHGDTIVVAVSGGPDSVALMHILKHLAGEPELGLRLVCAHVNHGFRGAESERDAEFVRDISHQLGIPFELGSFDIPAYMEQSGKGAQVAAREKRYEFLHDVARRYGASKIALAHHADDQAETVMMRILRGSGPSGLAGMRVKRREKNVELIRPLLRIYKTELVQACHSNGIEYVTDSSNLSVKYARNAVRLDVLPFLGQYNGQLPQSLNRLAELIREEDDYLDQEAARCYREMVRNEGGIISYRAASFATLHVALQRRLIKLILNYLPLSTEESDYIKIEAIRKGTVNGQTSTWNLDLGSGIRCIREYDVISYIPYAQGNQTPSYTYLVNHIPAEVRIPGTKHRLLLMEQDVDIGASDHGMPSLSKDEAIFDADELAFPLTVRSRLPGDVMKVMGLSGSKKVKDIFIDDKIPPAQRAQIPMIVDGKGRIVWIPGIRRSAIAAVTSSTSRWISMIWDSGE